MNVQLLGFLYGEAAIWPPKLATGARALRRQAKSHTGTTASDTASYTKFFFTRLFQAKKQPMNGQHLGFVW